MNAQSQTITADHRELFPFSGDDFGAHMRRISVVCDVFEIAKSIAAWGAPQGGLNASKGISNSLERCIDFHMRGAGYALEAQAAVYEYFAAYLPLSTDIHEMGRDERRAMMGSIMAHARQDEAKYRTRMRRAAA